MRHNAGLAPVAPAADESAGLPIPGLAALPTDPARLRIPYRIRTGQAMCMPAVRSTPAHEVKVEGEEVFVRIKD